MCCCGFGIQAQKTSFPVLRVDSSDIALKLQTLHYDDVETLVKKELAAAKRKKQSTETLEEYQRQAEAGVRYLQGTAQVMVIDSVVVDKANFLSAYGFTDAMNDDLQRWDVSRIAAQVVSGIGFIGAGTIIFRKTENVVVGLTTAAGLWVTAAIGLACGGGMYVLSIGSTMMVLVGLEAFNYFLHKFDKKVKNNN
jgi:uncharacterized membrane protein YhiD involved in acid resistance